jgi:glucosamine-6-phosphate deaminase
VSEVLRQFQAEEMKVSVFGSTDELGRAAAEHTAAVLREAVSEKGAARTVLATGNSQLPFVEALKEHTEIPWEKVTIFHMDEYAGMSADHPASFRKWIRERLEERFHPKEVHYIEGDAEDPESECRRYEALLKEAPIDLVCMGIGENGHIAFNDPPVADFDDPVWVKVVELDEACRKQQVGEGHFRSFDEVPTHAITLTVPALLAPASVQVVVPEHRKAEAVRRTLNDPISTDCPATILRTQSHARLFLDAESASLLGE